MIYVTRDNQCEEVSQDAGHDQQFRGVMQAWPSSESQLCHPSYIPLTPPIMSIALTNQLHIVISRLLMRNAMDLRHRCPLNLSLIHI